MAQDEVVVEKASKKRLSSAVASEDDEQPESKKRGAVSSADKADQDWTVDSVRGDHESVEHWELRKQFLEQNKDRFPNRHRLICLSQVFANMEFLGCRYPEETMELVHELSLGIVESYRERQKTRLQRTFVKASDAAERKTKGSNYKPTSSSSANDNDRSSVSMDRMSLASHFTSARPMQTFSDVSRNFSSSLDNRVVGVAPGGHDGDNDSLYGDLQRMILLVYAYNTGENAVSIVHRSCSASSVPINAEFQGSHENYLCTYRIGNNLVVESDDGHQTKEAAKSQAAKFAFEKLQKLCYTFVTKVKVSPNFEGKEIAKDEIDGKGEEGSLKEPGLGGSQLGASNIGNKLLKMMGWSGGGLGKNEQGIHEAISVDGVVGRSRLGLGNDSKGGFHKKIKDLLEQQKRAGFPHDLKFAADFSKDERKDIHLIAQKLGLRSKSYGKDEDRYIVVSEKVSRVNLLHSTLAAEGGETDKYKVIPPGGGLEGIEQFV